MKAEDFELLDKDENRVRLSDYKGKWVVLYFYPKDNTPGCTTEAKDFTAYAKEFSKLGAEIIGISPDSPKRHQNFVQKHNLSITLLSDPEHRVLKLYNAWGKKKMYGKEREGVIRTTLLIDPEGNIVRRWDKVKVKGHVEEVLKTLKELI